MKTQPDSEITQSDSEITSTSSTATIDLVTLVRVCFENRWITLLTVFASIIATVALSLLAPPTYQSIAIIDATDQGKLWVEKNTEKLLWQDEKPVHEVAKQESINLERSNAKALVRYEPVDKSSAKVVIEVTAYNPGISKRLAKSLADHFVGKANILSDRPHEFNLLEARYRDELVLQRNHIKLIRNKRERLQEHAEVLRETILGLGAASRETPTGLTLNGQRREVLDSLLVIDDRLLDLKMTVEDLKYKRTGIVNARELEVGSVSKPAKMEKRTLFNAIVAGFIALIVTAFLLYFRELRIDKTELSPD